MALSGIRTCNRPGRSLSWFPSRLQIVTEPRLAGEPRRITGLRVEERGMLRLDPGCSLAFRPVKYVPFEERRKASSTSAEYPRPGLSARFPELESRVIQEILTLRLHGSAIPRRSVQVHQITRTGAAAAAAECSSTRPARRSARSRPRAGERAVVSAIYSYRFAFIFEASTDWVIDR